MPSGKSKTFGLVATTDQSKIDLYLANAWPQHGQNLARLARGCDTQLVFPFCLTAKSCLNDFPRIQPEPFPNPTILQTWCRLPATWATRVGWGPSIAAWLPSWLVLTSPGIVRLHDGPGITLLLDSPSLVRLPFTRCWLLAAKPDAVPAAGS